RAGGRRQSARPAGRTHPERRTLPGENRQGTAHPGKTPAARHAGFRRPGRRGRSSTGRSSMTLVQRLKTVLFYLVLSLSAFLWGTLNLLVAPFLPFSARYRFVVQRWCRFAVWLAKVMVGVRYEVSGLENIPQRPCVILAKHQSTWETFFLSGFFSPLSQVLKRELMYVPFFGWSLWLMRPIAID